MQIMVHFQISFLIKLTKKEMNCIFCEIIDGTIPSLTVYENETVKCIIPKKMETYGHTLVIPKVHFENIWDISPEQLHQIVDATQTLSNLFQEKLGATGINLLHASGKDAGQSVPHFHFHIFPRFINDGIDAWPHLPIKEYDKIDFLKKIKPMDEIPL